MRLGNVEVPKWLTPLQWRSVLSLHRDNFSHVLETEAGKRVFNDAFMEKLRTRGREVERTFWRVATFNFFLVAALFVNSYVLHAEFRIGGFGPLDVGKLKEVIIFISATLAFFSGLMSMEFQFIRNLCLVWAEKTHGPSAKRYSRLLYGDATGQLVDLSVPSDTKFASTKIQDVLQLLFFVGALLFLLALLFTSLGVSIFILLDIYRHPTLPPAATWFVIAYVVLSYATNALLLLLFMVPLPVREYSRLLEALDSIRRKRI